MRITLTCPMVELSGNHNAASNLALDSKLDGYGIGPPSVSCHLAP